MFNSGVLKTKKKLYTYFNQSGPDHPFPGNFNWIITIWI